jgi:dTDP-4-dehydrorhamnose reductase
MKKILVTGANGQLGKELRDLASNQTQHAFLFLSREDLPIHQFELVRNVFASFSPDFCINCAAYTAVDKAESDIAQAFLLNATAAKNLAEASLLLDIPIIHISTDFVFNGLSSLPYIETDICDPINVYGASKLEGEKLIIATNPKHFVIRTSWLYSSFGNNFCFGAGMM